MDYSEDEDDDGQELTCFLCCNTANRAYMSDANSLAKEIESFIKKCDPIANSKDLNKVEDHSHNLEQEARNLIEESQNLLKSAKNMFAYDRDASTYNLYLLKLYECLMELNIQLGEYNQAFQIANECLLDAYKLDLDFFVDLISSLNSNFREVAQYH